MKHLDAKAVRDRLNSITLAIAALENCSVHPNHTQIAHAAEAALQEIAVLVTGDEQEQHGGSLPAEGRQQRRKIRASSEDGTPPGVDASNSVLKPTSRP